MASLTFADAASIRPSHNPANSPRLINKPIEGFRYDWGTGCKPANRIPSGMHALQRWLTRKVPRGESWGIHNCHVLPRGRRGGENALRRFEVLERFEPFKHGASGPAHRGESRRTG